MEQNDHHLDSLMYSLEIYDRQFDKMVDEIKVSPSRIVMGINPPPKSDHWVNEWMKKSLQEMGKDLGFTPGTYSYDGIWFDEVTMDEIKYEKRNKMRKLIVVLFTLLLFVLAAGFIYLSFQLNLEWGIFSIVCVAVVVLGVTYLALYDDKDNSSVTVEAKVNIPFPNHINKQLQELAAYRKKDEEEKQAEAARLQKKENKESLKKYYFVYEPDGSKARTLFTPKGHYALNGLASVLKINRFNNLFPIQPGITQPALVITEETHDVISNRTHVIEFDNKDLRDMVYEKLFNIEDSKSA